MSISDRRRVLAVLGPTNTGKTYLAVERMLGHPSGMIGFPLRLLARENYDKIVKAKGAAKVALVTGEEKIIPPGARYFVCTVESMPIDRPVDFLAVDEIQLCADYERGHVFTQRLLKARGAAETMFLGAETMRPLIRRLVPEAEFITRARFSRLSYSGRRKMTRLPPRSAVVAFSASDVYRMAEMIRRQRGGTAVVLGALSPRTRNAQVGMYQAGEVDYLVATDAIGMGLNMDIDHVAFARLVKYDGFSIRHLRATELAQIAGRAGRHMNDGTFGTTDEAADIDDEVVEAIESHAFEPLKTLIWRNADLDFRSPRALLKSLDARPPDPVLRRAPEADDQLALTALLRDESVMKLADNRGATQLLWDVCQIPDFRKTLTDAHTRLLAEVYRQLMAPSGRLVTDWVAKQIARLDRTEGDIDTLVARLAHIRTWTYISHHGEWLPDPRHWQEKARRIEDTLSDALHDRLTQRFVDRRSAMLVRSLKSGGDLLAAVTAAGDVLIEGEYVGRLDGFRFVPDAAGSSEDTRALLSVARRALKREMAERVRRLEAEPDGAFSLGPLDGERWNAVLWGDVPVATLVPGADPMRPAVRPLTGDLVEHAARDRIARRLEAWVASEVAAALQPLVRLREARVSGPARGIAFQLVEAMGGLPLPALDGLSESVGEADRKRLRALGVRFGERHVFVQPALKPKTVTMRARLWAVANRLIRVPALPAPGTPSVVMAEGVPPAFYTAIGFAPAGRRAVRLDRLEALAEAVRAVAAAGPFVADTAWAQLVGCTRSDLPALLTGLGYRAVIDADGSTHYHAVKQRPRRRRRRKGGQDAPETASPFAKLRMLDRA
ncbi:MAG: disulfide oxidoreductase [Alphaproteobacteria bacterium]|nr:disulfide oxidoreductase [Alphaproteobacteria bacterium]